MDRITKTTSRCPRTDHRILLEAACRAALTAGDQIRSLYNQPHEITMKGAINLVTEADLAAEAAILGSLAEDCPGIPFMTEESTATHGKHPGDCFWIIDPLDGTTNFAHGFPYFAVSIALFAHGKTLVGVVYAPMSDELFCAVKNCGAWLNGAAIEVTNTGLLIESLIGTGFPYTSGDNIAKLMRQFESVLTNVRDIRRAGAAALDLAYLACGRLDGFYELELQPWDTAAGLLLVEEAGGQVTDLTGGVYSPFLSEILASNTMLHPHLLRLLR
ncbi:inositol monophosphatase family protein [Desulfobulbus alkaliphilus]|uniref:inositol monophosphatase family protein n=1 Tax=Desulfobulbus alkaliphilus TaxID=869814 RepID=UPI0019656459|nr:inositol monophosphatase family protein [Desulfobulbus alkaliphilus]MBM9536460.1 inositol monophosphatase [Desulfobulbus alkaliphilus]